ncbi:MAG: copper resistance protein CopC [Caulobacterales bacterium 32-69-10]|nr:MAG: copper resistance protein CopC [Caulobacterales bacterium 32-69-10]
MKTQLNALAALTGAAALLAGAPAWAHAHLVASNPSANATVAAPKTITLTFSEKLAPAFSSFELVTAAKGKVAVKTAVSKDGKSITGAPQGALAAGAYKITWKAASSDGHRMTGEIAFKVS